MLSNETEFMGFIMLSGIRFLKTKPEGCRKNPELCSGPKSQIFEIRSLLIGFGFCANYADEFLNNVKSSTFQFPKLRKTEFLVIDMVHPV